MLAPGPTDSLRVMDTENSLAHPNRRRFKRCKYVARVGVFTQGIFSLEVMKQVSEGGMLIELQRSARIGDRLEISFLLQQAQYFHVVAEVAYVIESKRGTYQLGVRFLDAPPEVCRAIRRYADNQSPTS
jgi:hypothetical protein